MKLWNFELGKKILLVAEIGLNHNGSIELAKEMMEEAKESGADAVKFQSFYPEDLYPPFLLDQVVEETNGKTLRDFLSELSFSESQTAELKDFAEQIGVNFFSTPLSFKWVDFLDSLNVEVFKVASMDLNNYPLLRHIARKGKPIILSTGMAELWEILKAVKVIKSEGNEQIVVMHCVSVYPPEAEMMNLEFIRTLKEILNLHIGFSDHYPGIEFAVASVGFGAEIIEKHFALEGVDCVDKSVSITPLEFKHLRKMVDNVFAGIGRGEKKITDSERTVRQNARRVVYARENLKAGEKLTDDKVVFLRGSEGIGPDEYEMFYRGKVLSKDVEKFEAVRAVHFE